MLGVETREDNIGVGHGRLVPAKAVAGRAGIGARAARPDAERTAAEGTDKSSTVRLRRSSRALLADLLRPHRRQLGAAVALLLLTNAAAMSGPYLVMLGIGKGIEPLSHGDPTVIVLVGLGFVVAVVTEYLGRRGFLMFSGRIGQAMLLELRQRRLTWAQLMLRVFAADVLECPRCKGRRRLLAVITDPAVIVAFLERLGLPSRAPPLAPARHADGRVDESDPPGAEPG